MGRAERIAALQALLARVQKNARERGLELAARSAGLGHGLAPEIFEPADEARQGEPPRLQAEEAELDWTTLLRDDPSLASFADAKPSAPAEVPQPSEPAWEATAPETFSFDEPAPAPAADRAPAHAIDEAPAEGPPSELELAIRAHTERRKLPGQRELWSEAVYELKERRSTIPPAIAATVEIPPSTQAVPSEAVPSVPAPLPLAAAPLPLAPPLASAPQLEVLPPPPEDSVAIPPSATSEAPPPEQHPDELARLDALFEAQGPARPEPRRRGWLLWVGLALFAALVLALVVKRFVGSPAPTSTAQPSAPPAVELGRASTSASTSPARTSSLALPAASPSATAATAPSAAAMPLASATSTTSSAPPAISDPRNNGLLWIETAAPADVYLRGVRVGKSGEYIELPCGMGFVRIAAPGSVPAGESFPAWRGEGKAVFVPCGEAHKTKL